MADRRTITILADLVAFETVSRTPNEALLDYAQSLLQNAGARVRRVPYADGRANLFATLGPKEGSPIVLSGHTDVVPVEGQAWSKPPFQLTEEDGRCYGRGTADMKGFIASALAAAERAASQPLRRPLAVALSCDEEVGCVGVRPLIDVLSAEGVRPRLIIVGEPTSLSVAVGHKGKTAFRATAYGREGHSALAPFALNALHIAGDLLAALRARQAEIERTGGRDEAYDVPYTTVHAGVMAGGTALNIVPNRATVDFEIRVLPQDDTDALIAAIKGDAAAIVRDYDDPDAGLTIEVTVETPGLDTPTSSEAVSFVQGLVGSNSTMKVAFATEAGLFVDALSSPAVVCGPGSMRQGHRPDEFVTKDDLARCDRMMDRLIDHLTG